MLRIMITKNLSSAWLTLAKYIKFQTYGPAKSLNSDFKFVDLNNYIETSHPLGLRYECFNRIRTFISCVHYVPQQGHFIFTYLKNENLWDCCDMTQIPATSFIRHTIKQTPQDIYAYGKAHEFWNIPGHTPTNPLNLTRASMISPRENTIRLPPKKSCTVL